MITEKTLESLGYKRKRKVEIQERKNGILVISSTSMINEELNQISVMHVERFGVTYQTLENYFSGKSRQEILTLAKERYLHDDLVTDAPLKREVYNDVFLALPVEFQDDQIKSRHWKFATDKILPLHVTINGKDHSRKFADIDDFENLKIQVAQKMIFGDCELNGSGYMSIDGICKDYLLFDTAGIDLYHTLRLDNKEDAIIGKPIIKDKPTENEN